MSAIVMQIAGPAIAFLAALLYYELRHSPRVHQLETDVERLWDKETTPAERAAVANFVRQEAPAVKAALPILEGAALQTHLVGSATQWAADHGLRLTAQDIADEVKQGIAEGLPAAAKAAGAAVETAASVAVAKGVAEVASNATNMHVETATNATAAKSTA